MTAFDQVTNIQYHNWANQKLLDVAEKIPLAELMAGKKMSQGTPFETLRHMLDVDWSWRLACMNQVATTVLWEIEPLEDLAALRAYWNNEAAVLLDYVQGLSDDELEREVIPSWGKNPYKVKHILMHIVDHGANHRSEIGWHFTKLGHSVGDIGFMDYISQMRGS